MSLADIDAAELTQYRRRTPKSAALYERGARVMPGGDTRTGTFHLPYPLYISRGQGCRLWDADGNEYYDFLSNFTSLLHGHAHPALHKALVEQGTQGTVHGSANELQIRLAEVLCERVPSVERVRFCNSGTEATLFALRAAKAFTGRSGIMKMEGGYHGSHDQVAVATAPPFDTTPRQGFSPGALSEVVLGVYNDLETTSAIIERHCDSLAAVIVEPMMGAVGSIPATAEFLQGLREITSRLGILLILDEIITFRLGYGGMQERFGIKPDLTTFGKIIGGGLPVGAFGGRADVMATYDPTRSGSIMHSGTYNGNAATMAAGLEAMALYDRAAVDALNAAGDRLRATLNGIIEQHGIEAWVVGTGSVMQLHFLPEVPRNGRDAAAADRESLRALHLSMLNRGIFPAARQMYVLSTAMTDATLATFTERFADAMAPIAAELARV